jgi:hypothetical protein
MKTVKHCASGDEFRRAVAVALVELERDHQEPDLNFCALESGEGIRELLKTKSGRAELLESIKLHVYESAMPVPLAQFVVSAVERGMAKPQDPGMTPEQRALFEAYAAVCCECPEMAISVSESSALCPSTGDLCRCTVSDALSDAYRELGIDRNPEAVRKALNRL